MPGPGEAAACGALGEVVWGAQGDGVEQEQLEMRGGMGVMEVCAS